MPNKNLLLPIYQYFENRLYTRIQHWALWYSDWDSVLLCSQIHIVPKCPFAEVTVKEIGPPLDTLLTFMQLLAEVNTFLISNAITAQFLSEASASRASFKIMSTIGYPVFYDRRKSMT